jgi:hypothetical protein
MALLPGSAAIGAGDPATCPPIDQRGVRRVGRCDTGAYQLVVPATGPYQPIQRGGRLLPHVTFPRGPR